MRKTLLRTILGVIALAALVGCASAYALRFELGEMVISASASIEPRALPAHGGAPVTVSSATQIKATDGSTPAALKQIIFKFDKHGSVDTKGLPVCTAAKLAGTTPALARKRCRDAIVGEGTGRAKVELPGMPVVDISSPLTFFNAPASGGNPALLVHAYETVPASKTLVVPLTVERIKDARYGYQVKIQMPEIAAGFGSAVSAKAVIGKTWKRGGKTVGYANASCHDGRLQVYGTVSLDDGSFFPGTFVSPCHLAG